MLEIHYFAAARAARGVAQETLKPERDLASLLEVLGSRHTGLTAGGMSLSQVFERCSFLVDGRSVAREDAATTSLDAVSRVDVLPPFAGG